MGIGNKIKNKARLIVVDRQSPRLQQFLELDQILHCIDSENVASQGVARRLGAEKQREIDLFGHVADVWVTHRDAWTTQIKG